MTRRAFVITSGTAALGFGLTACGGSSKSKVRACSPRHTGTITIASNDDQLFGDPTLGTPSATEESTFRAVFGTLLWRTQDFSSLVPELVRSTQSNADFTVWRLTLRSGLHFSDGTPLTSRDVVFSLKYTARAASGEAFPFQFLKRLDAIDAQTVELRFGKPNAVLPNFLADALVGGVFPEHFGGQTAHSYFLSPQKVAGAFMVESFSPGKRLTLVRNPHYWDTSSVYPSRIVLTAVSDDNARMLGLQAGNFDIGIHVPPTLASHIPHGYRLVTPKESTFVDTLFLSSTAELLDDVKVRQAILYAIDRHTIALDVWNGLASPARSMIPTALHNSVLADHPPTYDLARAKALMAASRHPSGGSLELLLVTGDQPRLVEAQALQAQLAKIGIRMSIRQEDLTSLLNQTYTGKYQAVLYPNNYSTRDAVEQLAFDVGTNASFGRWPTGTIDRIYTSYVMTDDATTQRSLTREYENFYVDHVYDVPIVSPLSTYAVNDDLPVFPVDADGSISLASIYKC